MRNTFSIFVTPPQRNCHFYFGIITTEGCQKWQNVIPTLHEKQKKNASYGAWEADFSFLQPLSNDINIFAGTRPVLAGSGRFWPAFQRFWAKVVRSDPSQHAPGARMTVVNTNSLKLYTHIYDCITSVSDCFI